MLKYFGNEKKPNVRDKIVVYVVLVVVDVVAVIVAVVVAVAVVVWDVPVSP